MTEFLLSRARLRSDASISALAPLLMEGGRLAPHAGKALVWSLLADPGERRDFLWRWDADGRRRLAGDFLILSRRPPRDVHSMFEMEIKEFAPDLRAGDLLGFRLRANPVVRRKTEGALRSRRHDIVMNTLYDLPKEERAGQRPEAVLEVGLAWIGRQIEKAGGRLCKDGLSVDRYEREDILHRSGKLISFSMLDFNGFLEVREPTQFLGALGRGFGAAKAYGCGLMLVRRA